MLKELKIGSRTLMIPVADENTDVEGALDAEEFEAVQGEITDMFFKNRDLEKELNEFKQDNKVEQLQTDLDDARKKAKNLTDERDGLANKVAELKTAATKDGAEPSAESEKALADAQAELVAKTTALTQAQDALKKKEGEAEMSKSIIDKQNDRLAALEEQLKAGTALDSGDFIRREDAMLQAELTQLIPDWKWAGQSALDMKKELLKFYDPNMDLEGRDASVLDGMFEVVKSQLQRVGQFQEGRSIGTSNLGHLPVADAEAEEALQPINDNYTARSGLFGKGSGLGGAAAPAPAPSGSKGE